jgi:hypothetical protein
MVSVQSRVPVSLSQDQTVSYASRPGHSKSLQARLWCTERLVPVSLSPAIYDAHPGSRDRLSMKRFGIPRQMSNGRSRPIFVAHNPEQREGIRANSTRRESRGRASPRRSEARPRVGRRQVGNWGARIQGYWAAGKKSGMVKKGVHWTFPRWRPPTVG